MLHQHYGNNIILRLVLGVAGMEHLEERDVKVRIVCQHGKRLPFKFTAEGNTLQGTLFGRDQSMNPDFLSAQITCDKGTDRQQTLTLHNIIQLVSDSQQTDILPTQVAVITTDGKDVWFATAEQPAPRKPRKAATRKAEAEEPVVSTETPDVVLD